METMQIANSTVLWIACGLAVLVVPLQALLFAKKAYEAGPKVGLTPEQMKKAMKSSAITSIGPSIVILSGMLTLLITVGAPVAWMRLSMIGSVMFESIAAGIGTKVVGVELGVDKMTNEALAMAVWTMTLCSIGWVIFATFSATRMDKVQHKISGGDTAKLVSISIGAITGVFCAMCAPNLIKFYNFEQRSFIFSKHAIACILGGLIMFAMLHISKKHPALKEWNLTIAILAAMLITAFLPA